MRCTTDGAAGAAVRRRGWECGRGAGASLASPRGAGWARAWGNASGSCEEIGRTAGLTDESVCPTLWSKDFHPCGAGAFACQPISSQLPVPFPFPSPKIARLPCRLRNEAIWESDKGCETKPMGASGRAAGRGRDIGCPMPPAQIRTSGFPAYGSYLGCLASKRTFGYGCRIRGDGSHRLASAASRSQVQGCRCPRRRNACHQSRLAPSRKARSLRPLPGMA